MTRPINIYLQSRINEELPFCRVDSLSAGKTDMRRIHGHEIGSLRILVDKLIGEGVSTEETDGFFYGYSIPRIGKEFDLLKFTGTECLNIELKSRAVPLGQVLSQLKKNKYYLSHLGKSQRLYTVITDTMTCYRLSEGSGLKLVDFSEIVSGVKAVREHYLTDIDGMFRARDYLVSPLNTPERFIKGEYFLTQAQEQTEKKILADIGGCSSCGFFSLTGAPGTGKTLLLYDIARKLSAAGRTLVIHCGPLTDGQKQLDRCIENLRIISAECLGGSPDILSGHAFILVDEAHRMNPEQYAGIRDMCLRESIKCIFSSDPEQILTSAEKQNAILQRIESLPPKGRYVLSEKIRANRELASFIASVRNLNIKPRVRISGENVALAYAGNAAEACRIIGYFKKRGYVFIDYTGSARAESPFAGYEEDFDTRHVIGQEYDNVLMLLGDSFYYDDKGILRGVPRPDPDYLYPNMFYQGITRAREKIALVVAGSPSLFEKISSVFDHADEP